MSSPSTPGAKFRAALAAEQPLQIAGAINACCVRRSLGEGGRRAHPSTSVLS